MIKMKCSLYFVIAYATTFVIIRRAYAYHVHELYYDKPQTPLQKIRDFMGNGLNKFKSGNLLQDIDRQFGALPPNVLFAAGAGSIAFAGVAVQTGIAEDLINELNNFVNPTTTTTTAPTTTECNSSGSCPSTKPVCNNNVCRGCVENSECPSNACNTANGHCYQFHEGKFCTGKHITRLGFTLEKAVAGCNEDPDCGCIDFTGTGTYNLDSGTGTGSSSYGRDAWVKA